MNKKRLTLEDLEARYADFCLNAQTVKQAVAWQGRKVEEPTHE